MRKRWLLCVLLGTLAWGQAAPSAPPPPQPAQGPATTAAKPAPPANTSASVPDTAPVLTVIGVCPPAPKPAAKGAVAKPANGEKATTASTSPKDCKTVVTKADFEKILNALAPNPSPQQRQQLANVLPKVIAMSTDAKKRGMDKTEQYKESLKFAQMQLLSNQLQRKLQDEATNVPEADIEKYYKDNPEAFEQYNVDRIFIPRQKQAETEAKEDAKEEDNGDKLTDEQKKAKEDAEKAKTEEGEQAMTKLAEDLRARAATGEDIVKLQKEAFAGAGMKIETPTVNLPSIRRTGLPPGHAAVFDLKAGEVSQVISDNGGHYIYKMNSKTAMTLDQVKNEIHSRLQQDRMRETMEKVNGSFQVDKNTAYFGTAAAGPAPPPRMPRPRPGMPMPQGAMPAQQGPAGAPVIKDPAQPPAAQPPAPKQD